MHTEQQIKDIVRGIDAVTVLGTKGLTGADQQALEIDAIAVYLATQIATLKTPDEREEVMADFDKRLRECVRVRLETIS